MENLEEILKRLENAGYYGVSADANFIYMEDPTCILRTLETFIEYAWPVVIFLTGALLFGWAIAFIRGSKYSDIFINMRNLLLILFTLSVFKPILNLIYGNNFFARGCDTVKMSLAHVNELLELRDAKFRGSQGYEIIDIEDTGIPVDFISPMDIDQLEDRQTTVTLLEPQKYSTPETQETEANTQQPKLEPQTYSTAETQETEANTQQPKSESNSSKKTKSSTNNTVTRGKTSYSSVDTKTNKTKQTETKYIEIKPAQSIKVYELEDKYRLYHPNDKTYVAPTYFPPSPISPIRAP